MAQRHGMQSLMSDLAKIVERAEGAQAYGQEIVTIEESAKGCTGICR